MRPVLGLAFALTLIAQSAAIAGAPLKGVDVKLGKNPGGGAVSRVTDAGGHAAFGILARGDYTLTVSGAPGGTTLHLSIAGAAGGPVERDIAAGATARMAPTTLSLDGTAPLTVSVTAAGPAAASQ